MRRRHPAETGFTIVELVVVMSIVLLVVAGATAAAGRLFAADLSQGAGQFASSVRYLYSLSVLNNRSYRLMVDLDSEEYWGEEVASSDAVCGAILVEKEGKHVADNVRRGTDRPTRSEEEEGERATDLAFEIVKDNLLTRRRLPARVGFLQAITGHHSEVQETGQVAIHFFPAGHVEHAWVYLGDEDETFTITTRPLMGTAEVHAEELRAEDFFDHDS
jgi:hypothetical protein